MTAAPIHYEPTDPDLPIVAVTPEAFEAIAREVGAVLEVGADGPVVVLRGCEYVCAVA